jgi:hypothetical protein
VRFGWLDSHLVGSEILDYGCSYGRLLVELARCGYGDRGDHGPDWFPLKRMEPDFLAFPATSLAWA